jgi:hypothetical protein
MQGLERPIFLRRRRWAAVVIGVAIPVHLAALYALLARPDRVTYSTRTETIESTSVIHMPAAPIIAKAPVAVPPPTPRECPAPNRKATNTVVPAMAHVEHVYASPTNVDWLVAWNEASVYSSTDGGRSFREVLAGKGRVLSATIDCFGNVLAARGIELGVHSSGTETWRTVPGIDFTDAVFQQGYSTPAEVWLVGGGPDVVVVGFEESTENKSRAAMSSDLGRTWSFHDLSDGDFQGGHIASRQRPDGAVDLELEIEDCGGSWLETFTIANGAVSRVENPSEEDETAQAALRARVVKRDPWRETSASIDAAGRPWVIECGAPQIKTRKELECSEGAAE